ncbi:MAG: neutral zinc metallopeptidase [Pseudomonadota bacterium]
MRWKGRRKSSNVDDQRGSSRGGGFGFPGGMGSSGRGMRIPTGGRRRGGGGMGIGTLIIIGIILWFLGINPLKLLGGGLGGGLGGEFAPNIPSPQTQRTQPRTQPPGNDEMKEFVETILGSTEEVWTNIFNSYGQTYPKPRLNLFTGQVRSACGQASSATGPFYCPADSEVYIDLSFYQQLEREFGAGGDFAQAYVIAHEVAHHVQNVIGVLPQFNKMRRTMGKIEVNKMSVKVELQADCYAGIWGHYVAKEGWLEAGDLEEALVAANQIGDDTIQKRTQGYVVPESFSHGTSEQRQFWFRKGFETGRVESCDTFKARRL